jgi:cellulose synthase/poly-beta-1,6-N-acetylglucosamine synthase-like glycosyltransferase
MSTKINLHTMLSTNILIVLFSFIAGAYYLIIILVLVGLNKSRTFRRKDEPFHTRVTVIIPARNEESNILDCLNDLLQQDFPQSLMEIIFVDDSSDDQTLVNVNNFAGRNPAFPLSILRTDLHNHGHGSKKNAIKLAISRSSGELIMTTDADTRFGNKWISAMVGYYEAFNPEMILGPVAYFDGHTLFSKIQSCEFMGLMAVTEGFCNLNQPVMCNGANLAYSRKAFDMVGGFEDNLDIPSGDDMFLMMKIRRKFGRDAVHFNRSKETIVLTESNKSLYGFLQQRLRWVSKNKGYKNPVVLLVAGVTYLFNAALLIGIIAGFFVPFFWILTLLLLLGKIILEVPVMVKYAKFLGKTNNLILMPLAQILNIFYVSVIGFLGNFISYNWKGRTVNPIRKQ